MTSLTLPLQKRLVLDDSHGQTCGERGKEHSHEATGRRLVCPAAGNGGTRLVRIVGVGDPSLRTPVWHGVPSLPCGLAGPERTGGRLPDERLSAVRWSGTAAHHARC